MATKASSTLLLIIEKQHAAWNLMGTTLPPVQLRTVLCTSHRDRRGRRSRMGLLRQHFRGLSHCPLEFFDKLDCFAVRSRCLTRSLGVLRLSSVEWPCRGTR